LKAQNAPAETIIGLFKTEVVHRLGQCTSKDQVEWETLQMGKQRAPAAAALLHHAHRSGGPIPTNLEIRQNRSLKDEFNGLPQNRGGSDRTGCAFNRAPLQGCRPALL